MPIGYDCEYDDFDACVADHVDMGHSEAEARRICGAIQRDTEESCKENAMNRLRAFTNAEGKRSAEVMIYDVIGSDWFSDGIDAKGFVDTLNALGQLDEISVRINSPGGSIFDADAIYNALVRHPAAVTVNIDGIAASSASWVAMAGDEINIAPNAMMMIHLAQGMVMGDRRDMIAEANILSKLDQTIANTYAKRTGRKANTFLGMMENETWFTAEEALNNKLVDRITNEAAKNRMNCFGPECFRNFKRMPDSARRWFKNEVKKKPCGCNKKNQMMDCTCDTCGAEFESSGEAQKCPECGSDQVSCDPMGPMGNRFGNFIHNSKTSDSEPDWGGVDKTALPMLAFADHGDGAEKKSTWSYPHHWVQDAGGKDENGVWTTGTLLLHKQGLDAAWSAANGGRSGEKAPQAVIDHLQEHRRALGLDKPDNVAQVLEALQIEETLAEIGG